MTQVGARPATGIACPPGALAGGPTRTRFFDGMFLTQADLETEQRYWRLKRRLTNRALGAGVVWGLRLTWDERRRAFTLAPGYALDCCGNDLVVECPVEVSEQELWSRADPALRAAGVGRRPPREVPLDHLGAVAAPEIRRACVVLQYVECPEEPRPVHRDACGGPSPSCEPSRIRESTRLLLVPPPSRPPPTPPEVFLDELTRWRDGLPAEIRDVLFPPQGAPAPVPATGLAPLSLRTTVPGTPAASTTLQVPATGSVSAGAALQAQQTPSPGRPTGVVTFELHPSAGWSLTAGRVTDQGRVVETVTPPAAPSMYWALDVALPQGTSPATTRFEFVLDELELAQTFGGTRRGRVRARVTGSATAAVSGSVVTVTVEGLTITTERAEVFEDADGQGCLRELVPWGWAVDPANGSRIARVLVLASLYAFLSEVTRRGSTPPWRTLATILYVLAWRALFGADPLAPVAEEHRRKLAELILALYRRWCDGFVYPGPRCADEHHGVYLGCVEVTRTGAIRSFDPWAHRRHVVTGPLLEHWGRQLGIAPVDVIVGRFADAICCLAGLPAIVPPGRQEGPILTRVVDRRFHVGTDASVAAFARDRGGPVTWVAPSVLPLRISEAFVARPDMRDVEVLAARLPDGGSIAIAVPRPAERAPGPRVRGDVLTLLRRGELHVREAGRAAVVDFTGEVLRAAPATALVGDDAPEPTRRLAEAVARRGATVADVAEDGTDAIVVRSGLDDTPETRDAAAELVERAERAVDGVVRAAVTTLGPRLDRAAFGRGEHPDKLGGAIARRVIPGLSAEAVASAARRVAGA